MDFWQWFFLFLIYVPLLMIWGATLIDIFSRRDITGWWKAIDVALIIIFPFIGTLIYLIVRPKDVAGVWGVPATSEYAYAGAPPANVVNMSDELEKLSRLRSSGALTEEEFVQAKKKLLAA